MKANGKYQDINHLGTSKKIVVWMVTYGYNTKAVETMKKISEEHPDWVKLVHLG